MKMRLGLAMCGSFCTFERVLEAAEKLAERFDIIPIMSETAAGTDTRFGRAEDFKERLRLIAGKKEILTDIVSAEPIGPKNMLDVLAVAPCTGNTLAKIAAGVTDTAVTMAVKSQLRGGKPVVLALSTNDGLSGSAANLGALLSRENVYFVPFGQDDAEKKPRSLSADFSRIEETVFAAAAGRQVQPIILNR